MANIRFTEVENDSRRNEVISLEETAGVSDENSVNFDVREVKNRTKPYGGEIGVLNVGANQRRAIARVSPTLVYMEGRCVVFSGCICICDILKKCPHRTHAIIPAKRTWNLLAVIRNLETLRML